MEDFDGTVVLAHEVGAFRRGSGGEKGAGEEAPCPYQISLLSGKRFSMSEIVATRSSTRSVEWVAGFVLSGLLLVMVLYGTGNQWNTEKTMFGGACLGFSRGATRRISNIFCCY